MEGLNTLIDYRYQQHFKAKTGGHGMGRLRAGANSDDIVLKVPVGTQVFEEDNETMIADLSKPGDRFRVAKGGNGGFGNAYFKSSTNRAPRHANPGQEGEERWIWLQLKLIADAGIAGPSQCRKVDAARRSLSRQAEDRRLPVHHASPAAGRRPRRHPELRAGRYSGPHRRAHEGHGLGTRFLGHVERCAVLLHLIDVSGEDPVKDYRVIRKELKAYSPELAEKPEVIAFNKTDLLPDEEIEAKLKEFKRRVRKTPS